MKEINEVWRDIEGYEGLYQVSNMGRVKRVKGYDSLSHLRNEKILSPETTKNGYLRVILCKEGKVERFLVHRLVGMAFIPNPEGLPEINHRDEDKTNNLVDNLEYCDRKYNCNYGTHTERQVQTKISKGLVDPEMCGLDKKERNRLYYQKNRDQINSRRRKKKQPSEESLW